MFFREIIAVCSEIHIKTVWAESRIVDVKLVVHMVTTGLQRVKPLL
jgi:cytochrome b